jgi:hypothetical protein
LVETTNTDRDGTAEVESVESVDSVEPMETTTATEVDLTGALTVAEALERGYDETIRMVAVLAAHAEPCPPCPPQAQCEACAPEAELYGDPPDVEGSRSAAWVQDGSLLTQGSTMALADIPIGARVLLVGRWVIAHEAATDRIFSVSEITVIEQP